MIKKYSLEIEQSMKATFFTLNEKTRRIYAATEAEKLGYGGIKYISELFSIDPKTIRAGKKELEILKKTPNHQKRKERRVYKKTWWRTQEECR